MTLKLLAQESDYSTEHTLNLTSKRIKLPEHDNQVLHTHYDNAIDIILAYLNQHWNKSRYSSLKQFLNSDIHYRPKLVKGKKILAKELRRLTHIKEHRPSKGKYYSHWQLLHMIEEKANKHLKTNKFALQDWTESMYRRFNAYIEWLKEWDSKFNNGNNYAQLDSLKVRILWQK